MELKAFEGQGIVHMNRNQYNLCPFCSHLPILITLSYSMGNITKLFGRINIGDVEISSPFLINYGIYIL